MVTDLAMTKIIQNSPSIPYHSSRSNYYSTPSRCPWEVYPRSHERSSSFNNET